MKWDNADYKEKLLEQLVSAVLKSVKYRNVCEDLIENIGSRELSKGQNLKLAIKATKNKLHQIGGAYLVKKPKYGVWLENMRNALKAGNEELFRKVCLEILDCHYSTRERSQIVGEFYSKIFANLPPIDSIMDVACGFNPLSIPWMPISEDVKYYAYDIYKDMIDFINKFMDIRHVRGRAEVRDVVQNPPEVSADLAFFFDAIPCFEQIEKGASEKVLEFTNSKFIAVSFPVKSLCGREKNMRKHYETMFNRLIKEKNWISQRLEFKSELVFLITK